MSDHPLAPGLYVAATPIGNLGDVTRRLTETLAAADEVLCEDSRVSGRLMQALGLDVKLRAYHDHNGAAVRPGILKALADGARIVLISDAGTPLISDPGYKLVAEARAQGTRVYAVPGPCAAIAALSIAGAPTDKFSFLGFLPPKQGARQKALYDVASRTETLVFYETGPRLGKMLADVVTILGDRPVVIARELTKLHEEAIDGMAAALAETYTDHPPKGEIVVILPAHTPEGASEADVDALMAEALGRLSLKDAAHEVAQKTGRKKRDLYQAWLDRMR